MYYPEHLHAMSKTSCVVGGYGQKDILKKKFNLGNLILAPKCTKKFLLCIYLSKHV